MTVGRFPNVPAGDRSELGMVAIAEADPADWLAGAEVVGGLVAEVALVELDEGDPEEHAAAVAVRAMPLAARRTT